MAMTKTRLDFGPWEPDAALLNGAQAPEARNVIPAARGYRPLPSAAALNLDPMPSQVKAAYARHDMYGTNIAFAAAAGGIYALEGGSWVQKYAGATASDVRAFAEYGDAVYALFGSKLLKSALSGVAGEFHAVEGAPAGEALGVIRDFLMLGRLSEQKNAVRWSGLDRPDEWPEPGGNEAQYVQSDMQVFPVGGQVQAVVGGVGGVDGLIFLERAIQRATYVGMPYIFQFDTVDREHGCAAPYSPVVCAGTCVFLSEDGWRMTDGVSVKAVGVERVDSWFFNEASLERLGEVRGVHDNRNRVALWSFATPDAPPGVHDRLLVYNYMLDRWSYGTAECEALFQDRTRGGMSLEELDGFGSLDALPFASLDLALFKDGDLGVISCFDASHRLGNFTGPPREAVIDTAEHGGDRMMVHGLRPLVDAAAAGALPVYRNREMDARRFGAYTKQQRDGVCYQHLSTVYLSARVKIPAGENWNHAVGVEALVEAEGGM
ncbi:hypothetical protein [Mailhella massiliensis]|uniref:Uncharacterized protein n=1 Tax=Mailhella massiliensis TaxID=1903261 RepID=A0A921AY30_9BACT|nr:hypothetical protein [Mailhella massiliensis]HJD98011.1 hypothetical protein [Mailhella massiliensis]